MPNTTHIVMHYSEIALKGTNRLGFEHQLVRNISLKLGKLSKDVQRESGQIVAEVDAKDLDKAVEILKKIPGIAYLSPAVRCSVDMEEIKKSSVDFLKGREFSTFKVEAKRHSKGSKFNSNDINNEVGAAVIDKLGVKAKMKDPDITLKVELSNKYAYLSCEKIPGVGGLPTNNDQKVVALLSGGMDSPVAAYMMMKRGCKVIFVHFQNSSQMASAVKDKIAQLAKQLSSFQTETKLYIVPFDELQKAIIANVHSSIRMLIYRKFMAKIAARIAEKEGARFLVTGDSLSQVSSQTIGNLSALYASSEMHILSPLVGMNKDEIMDTARRIGTYDISALPYGDCCSFFMPEHPELRATADMLQKAEEEIEDAEKLVERAVGKVIVKEF